MIVFVCEGNVCRSPLAAALLRRALGPGGAHVPISSAGIRALAGEPVDEGTSVIAERLGLDLTDHRSRQVTPEILADSCLVLAATRKVRRAVVQLHPPAVQYAFTIRQLGRILAAASHEALPGRAPDQVTAVCAFALKQRGAGLATDPRSDDVVDPHRRPQGVYEAAVKQMLPALTELAVVLGGEPIRWPERGWLARLGLDANDRHR